MRALWIAGGLLLAACLAACSDDAPAPAQPQQAESAVQERQAEPVQESSATTATTPPQQETRKNATQSSVEVQQTQAQLVEEADPAAKPARNDDDAGDEDDTDNAPVSALAKALKELTDVPAVVLVDAEVRVRPGLPWPAIDRLRAGDSATVLNRASGWLRVRSEDTSEGWIISSAVDLGRVKERHIREEPAPPIIAEWQGVEYGVIGQSADGAEVRMLGDSEEVVSAPKGEVMLMADDITVDDLPVLIGDETVVFPGDDFRAGQGKILPRADEWMWLPWGWLLAHNEEYIWQWHPETDELEFIRRPPGYASFSPGGESLAILTCGGEESCFPYLDVTILPLDGTPMVRLMDHAEVNQSLGALKAISILWCNDWMCHDFFWTSDGRGLLTPLVPETATSASAAALLHADKQIAVFDPWSPPPALPEGCSPAPSPSGVGWRLGSDDGVTFTVTCVDDAEGLPWRTATYDASGQSITVRAPDSSDQQVSDVTYPYADVVDQLGDGAYVLRGGTDQRSIGIDAAARQLFTYDQAENHLRPINHDPYVIPDWLWELLERGPQIDYQRWDFYWSNNNQVAAFWRTGITHIATAFLVDVAMATAVPLPIGAVRTWRCFPTGGWSPDGTIFQIEFEASSGNERLERLWIDGTAAPGSKIAQRQIVSSEGEPLAVMRALAHLKYTEPAHIARWSPDGRWLAIGGHQELDHCY